ncbi:hypothetical protein LEP1GSC194_3899 [Leptospira alstonii serovar Sichuan str. 79601]|uniref:Uncharacterized protein n=1 Tax=Leptospira alstonii serovar Sichuan str. 79601 TaxID=1218565 RepID=M6CNY0_9LEPT|nr:hypothetical protein LEP1GSC194_3899 [Leptospira alstonii serovar Sichuan str. 79601]
MTIQKGIGSLRSKPLYRRADYKKVILLPGMGFDVVPTDCLALMLNFPKPVSESSVFRGRN